MLLIKNCTLYSPRFESKKDVLLCSGKIIYISSNINVPDKNFPDIHVIDGEHLTAVPGFIDLHVHITGGGGEGGFTTRVPEMQLTDFTTCGITTCVGLLGTDGTTRSMAALLAKARALELEGISTLVWTGSYEVPTRTISDSARGDIILIDKIIGIGEIAISDHRSSHPSDESIVHLASEARVGGLLSGKCGILHVHIGDEALGLKPIIEVIKKTNLPYDTFLPTHINRKKNLFIEAVEYCKMGGYVDITTGIVPEGDDAMYAADCYNILLQNNIDPEHITMSSDSGGSMPIFNEKGKLIKFGIAKPTTFLDTLKRARDNNVDLESALMPFTASPAKLLKLIGKGEIKEGMDADILLLDEKLQIHTTICKGEVMIENYKIMKCGLFENPH